MRSSKEEFKEESRVIGTFKGELGPEYTVKEMITMVPFTPLGTGVTQYSPGSRRYVASGGVPVAHLALNKCSEDNSRFKLVHNGMEISRVDPTE